MVCTPSVVISGRPVRTDLRAGRWLIVLVSAAGLAGLGPFNLFDAVSLVGCSEPHYEAGAKA